MNVVAHQWKKHRRRAREKKQSIDFKEVACCSFAVVQRAARQKNAPINSRLKVVVRSPTRLSWVEMVVGVPEAPSFPGYSHHTIHLAFFGSLDSHFLLNLLHMWYYINNVDSSSLFLMLH